MAQPATLRHRGPDGFPIFSASFSPGPTLQARNSSEDRLQIQGLAKSLSTLGPKTSDHVSKRASSKSTTRNSSAPKPRLCSESIIAHEHSRRVSSMRLTSASSKFNPSATDGQCFQSEDEVEDSSSHRLVLPSSQPTPHRQTIGNVCLKGPCSVSPRKTFISSSVVPDEKGYSPDVSGSSVSFEARHGSTQAAPGKASSTKAALKYLNAKVVTEKLVRALTNKGEIKLKPSADKEAHKQEYGVEIGLSGRSSPGSKCARSKQYDGAPRSVPSPPRLSVENDYYTDKVVLPVSTEKQHLHGFQKISSYVSERQPIKLSTSTERNNDDQPALLNLRRISESCFDSQSEGQRRTEYDLDPLEDRASELEEQAANLAGGNLFSDDDLTPEDGETGHGSLRLKIDNLKRELRIQVQDKRDLTLQLASELRARLSERETAEKALRRLRADLESKLRMLEGENGELRRRMQAELEQTEVEWMSKVEKLKSKEKRQSERLKEIAEEKVELQKEIASLTSKKNALLEEAKESQISVRTLKQKLEESGHEILRLKKAFEEASHPKLHENEGNTAGRKKFSEKELAIDQKHKKLQRVCREQEKTIQGLRHALSVEAANGKAQGGKGEFFIKLQRELVRLTGIEQGLRNEVEAYRGEAYAVREENAHLTKRLDLIMHKLVNSAARLTDYEQNGDRDHVHEMKRLVNSEETEPGALEIVTTSSLVLDPASQTEAQLTSSEDDRISQYLSLALVPTSQRLYFPEIGKKPAQGQMDNSESTLSCITDPKPASTDQALELEEPLSREVAPPAQNRARFQEESENLHTTLALTNQRVRELESQLSRKEEELGGMQEELGQVKEQRDKMQKEADYMGREAIRLSIQVERLSKKVEKLDEDVMMKEGQLSILRGTFQEVSD